MLIVVAMGYYELVGISHAVAGQADHGNTGLQEHERHYYAIFTDTLYKFTNMRALTFSSQRPRPLRFDPSSAAVAT